MQRRPPLPVIIILLLLIISAGVYFVYFAPVKPVSTALTASGTVEATSIAIGPEVAGKVTQVLVKQGDSVKAGDVLFLLDGTLLNAQRDAASAGLDSANAAVTTAQAAVGSAQAQYDIALTTALNEDKVNRTASWTESKPSDFNKPTWYFNRPEETLAAQKEQDSALTALTGAQDNLKFVQEKATSGDYMAAEARLLDARIAYQAAQDVLTLANAATDGPDLKTEAQNAFDDAKSELTDAQKAYDDSMTTTGATDVLQARAKLFVVQERADMAADRVRAMQTGLLAPKVIAAQKVLDQASASVEQAKLAVKQAQVNLNVLDVQISKLTIVAPIDAVVLSRNVEPGEVVNSSSVVLSLAQLSELTITVYMPEDRYGKISLGQAVDVSVDSFAGEIFTASVIEISDKAEFTPRNVQTAEGRKSTVFAIKLRVENPDGKLKPGMPADVKFK